MIEWHIPCGSFESESIGIDNVRIVQKVFLNRRILKQTRSSADADKSREGPDRPIRSRIPGSISDTGGPVGTNIKMFNFEKCCDLEIGVRSLKMTPFDRPNANVC